MSVCDTCPVPGHCCRAIVLNNGEFASHAETTEEAQAHIDRWNKTKLSIAVNGFMPFRPLFKQSDGRWRWWCPNLSPETGRCLDYENRPVLCRSYQPGTDRLCVLTEEPVP